MTEPGELTILGDGQQSKSYIHVSDVITRPACLRRGTRPFAVFNVATGDYVTVSEIAALATSALGLEPAARDSTTPEGPRLERRRAGRSLEYRPHSSTRMVQRDVDSRSPKCVSDAMIATRGRSPS